MSFTKAELRARVYRMLRETSENNRIDASGEDLDQELTDTFNELAIEYETFLYTKVVPVVESKNVFDLSTIQPSAAKLGDNAGWGERLHDVVYQRGESAAISSTAVADSVLTVTSTAHGLSVDDIVYIYNTETFNGRYTVLSTPSDDTFTVATSESDSDETGVWVKASTYRKRSLQPIAWEGVEEQFYTPDNPSSSYLPRGTLWLTWVCAPGDLPDDNDVAEHYFPSSYVGVIADETALRFMENMGDALRNEPPSRIMRAIKALGEKKPTPSKALFGKFKVLAGVYAYRHRVERSLIIKPVLY